MPSPRTASPKTITAARVRTIVDQDSAWRRGGKDDLRAWLASGGDPFVRGRVGTTIAHGAATWNAVDVIDAWLAALPPGTSPDPVMPSNAADTPAFDAVFFGNHAVLGRLLVAGAKPMLTAGNEGGHRCIAYAALDRMTSMRSPDDHLACIAMVLHAGGDPCVVAPGADATMVRERRARMAAVVGSMACPDTDPIWRMADALLHAGLDVHGPAASPASLAHLRDPVVHALGVRHLACMDDAHRLRWAAVLA